MDISYEYIDGNLRCYKGLSFDKNTSSMLISGPITDSLRDQEEHLAYKNDLLETKAQLQAAGYDPSEILLDILSRPDIPDSRVFRIGEAFAELILEREFSAKFFWNELRDARNPKGNKTGPDLVGFIEIDDEVLFLFGEVKTSSERDRRPPQVMTGRDQMEVQLRDLHQTESKRKWLIKYLASKTRDLDETSPFRKAYKKSQFNFFRKNPCNGYVLFGVLIRDIEPDEEDLKKSYMKLSKEILSPTGINLIACYIPISKEDWPALLNLNQA